MTIGKDTSVRPSLSIYNPMMPGARLIKELEIGSFATSPFAREWPETLRIVSWNVNRGLQLNGIIEFLQSSSADLILLQETDVNARRTRHRNIPREIAQALRLNYIFGREFEELAQGTEASPAYHGQTTLSRLPLSNPRILRFRDQSTFWRPRWFVPPLQSFQRRLGGRMALTCDITLQSRTLVLYNLHLESRGNDELRIAQLSEMLTEIRKNHPAETPVLVAGDFNFDLSRGPATTLIDTMRIDNRFASFGGRRTVPNHAKAAAIDWILTRGALSARDPEIHDSVTASDHFPLSLELRMLSPQ
jgi:endonuclease/exonuclease/phosphatase family metal-dependent hydrolase